MKLITAILLTFLLITPLILIGNLNISLANKNVTKTITIEEEPPIYLSTINIDDKEYVDIEELSMNLNIDSVVIENSRNVYLEEAFSMNDASGIQKFLESKYSHYEDLNKYLGTDKTLFDFEVIDVEDYTNKVPMVSSNISNSSFNERYDRYEGLDERTRDMFYRQLHTLKPRLTNKSYIVIIKYNKDAFNKFIIRDNNNKINFKSDLQNIFIKYYKELQLDLFTKQTGNVLCFFYEQTNSKIIFNNLLSDFMYFQYNDDQEYEDYKKLKYEKYKPIVNSGYIDLPWYSSLWYTSQSYNLFDALDSLSDGTDGNPNYPNVVLEESILVRNSKEIREYIDTNYSSYVYMHGYPVPQQKDFYTATTLNMLNDNYEYKWEKISEVHTNKRYFDVEVFDKKSDEEAFDYKIELNIDLSKYIYKLKGLDPKSKVTFKDLKETELSYIIRLIFSDLNKYAPNKKIFLYCTFIDNKGNKYIELASTNYKASSIKDAINNKGLKINNNIDFIDEDSKVIFNGKVLNQLTDKADKNIEEISLYREAKYLSNNKDKFYYVADTDKLNIKKLKDTVLNINKGRGYQNKYYKDTDITSSKLYLNGRDTGIKTVIDDNKIYVGFQDVISLLDLNLNGNTISYKKDFKSKHGIKQYLTKRYALKRNNYKSLGIQYFDDKKGSIYYTFPDSFMEEYSYGTMPLFNFDVVEGKDDIIKITITENYKRFINTNFFLINMYNGNSNVEPISNYISMYINDTLTNQLKDIIKDDLSKNIVNKKIEVEIKQFKFAPLGPQFPDAPFIKKQYLEDDYYWETFDTSSYEKYIKTYEPKK